MASISSWTEAILLSLLFAGVLTIILGNFNLLYNKDYTLPFADTSGVEQLFIEYQGTSQDKIQGGEVSFDAQQGITLKSSWGLLTDSVSITWKFISGGWIENVVDSFNLGESGTALAKALRIIYFLSLVFALLYTLFKIIV